MVCAKVNSLFTFQTSRSPFKFSNDDIIDTYKTSDFRQTFVWRGLCFESHEKRAEFNRILEEKDYTDLEEILLKLQDDMHKKGYIKKTQTMETMGRADFARTLLVS